MDAMSQAKGDVVLRAAGEPVRWRILQVLAEGQALPVRELARRLGLDPDLVSKHLRVLRETGLVKIVEPPGEDRRKQFHVVAVAPMKDEAGRVALDFGAVVLRFG